MTYDQFWYGSPDLYWSYLEAYEMKWKQKMNYDNQIAHLQGQYFVLALGEVLQGLGGKARKKIYPEKPFSLESKTKEQKVIEHENKRKEQMLALRDKLESAKRSN